MKFDRNITDELLKWSQKSDRQPLVLRGARQVGKTDVLQAFGEQFFEKVYYYDFEDQRSLHQIFEGDLDVDQIIKTLSLREGETIDPDNSLIIFDEIQACKRALTSLKYFAQKAPQYTIASAGSLLGLSLGEAYSFPVGKVDFLDLYPLTFEEYLRTANKKVYGYYNHILNGPIEPSLDMYYDALMDQFRDYYTSGGMPASAVIMATTRDRDQVIDKQEKVLFSYNLDFAKHAKSAVEGNRIRHIWNSIPSQLGKENKKFIYRVVRSGARAREYESALLWLNHAGLVHVINRIERPMIPLKAYDDLSAFKVYTLDVGLLARLSDLNLVDQTEKEPLFREFKGAMAESYVCQSLIPQFDTLPKYWTSGRLAEVDFVIQYQNNIIPIEVKFDSNTKSQSLRSYNTKYKPEIRVRVSTKNLTIDGGLLNVPIFFADKIKYWIDKALEASHK